MNSPTMQPAAAQQPMAGLGALAQPMQQPAGKSPESMGQIMALAKGMSDAELADILSGKSLDIPQFAAMTEAMGRKSLRTAMQGQEAQGQLNKPTVKQQALADLESQLNPQPAPQAPMQMAQAPQAGIDKLPAQNMESMDMAAGGIVAFGDPKLNPDEKQEVKDEYSGPEASDLDKRIWKAITHPSESLQKLKDRMYGPNPVPSTGAAVNATPAEVRGAFYGRNPSPDMAPASVAKQPIPTDQAIYQDIQGSSQSPTTIPTVQDITAQTATKAKTTGLPAVVHSAQNAGSSGEPQGLDAAYAAAQAKAQKDADTRYSKIAGYGDDVRSGLKELKNQNQSDILFNLAGAMFGNPNMNAALGQGLPGIAKTAAAGRKEQAELTKAANEYDLNIAKAQEAAASGNMKEYNDYMHNAEQAKYWAMAGKAQLMHAAASSSMANNENKMSIAVGNKVMTDVADRLKNDVKFRSEWNKMSPDQQAAYYQKQHAIATSVYSGKMDPAAFGGSDLTSAINAELKTR